MRPSHRSGPEGEQPRHGAAGVAHRSHHDDQRRTRRRRRARRPTSNPAGPGPGGAQRHAAGGDHRGRAPQARGDASGPPNEAPGPWRRAPRAAAPTRGCRCRGRRGRARARGRRRPSTAPMPAASSAVPTARARDGPTASEPDEAHEEQRPHQVVLLLDGQRPRVQERVGRLEVGEVVVAGRHLLPVGDVEERRHRGGAQLRRHHAGPSGQRVEGQRRQEEEQGREQAPGPAGPEGTEPDPARGGLLGQQQARDQEPGQDEEDVHAVPAAAEEPEVVRDHGGDGHAADAVERRPVPVFAHSPQDAASLDSDSAVTLPAPGRPVDG